MCFAFFGFSAFRVVCWMLLVDMEKSTGACAVRAHTHKEWARAIRKGSRADGVMQFCVYHQTHKSSWCRKEREMEGWRESWVDDATNNDQLVTSHVLCRVSLLLSQIFTLLLLHWMLLSILWPGFIPGGGCRDNRSRSRDAFLASLTRNSRMHSSSGARGRL